MKGYRCDNCLDFCQEVAQESSEMTRMFGGPQKGPPPSWFVLIERGSGSGAFHFCGCACLNAYSERVIEIESTHDGLLG